jgi:hypothetical protein
MKQCTFCWEIKDFIYFNKNSHSSDGFRPSCKSCDKLSVDERALLKESNFKNIKEIVCNKCNETKKLEQFNNSLKSRTGKSGMCKSCTSLHDKNNKTKARTNGTLEYFKCNTWNNIKRRVINGNITPNNKAYADKGIMLKMTKEEFYEFCDNNKDTIMDFYSKQITPSLDRIDPYSHYQIGNLQIISFDDNRRESNIRNREKVVLAATIAKHKKVIVTDLNGNKAHFNSIKEAASFYKAKASGFSKVLKKERKLYKGLYIEYNL